MFPACPKCHPPPFRTAYAPLKNGISGGWEGTLPAPLAPSWPCYISFKIRVCQATFLSWIAVSDHLSSAVLTFIFQVEDFVYSFPDHATDRSRTFSLFFSDPHPCPTFEFLGFLPLSSWSLMKVLNGNRSNWSASLWEPLTDRSDVTTALYMRKYIRT